MEWVDLSNVECSMWDVGRSGEGRVGEEGRSWGSADHLKKKKNKVRAARSHSRRAGAEDWRSVGADRWIRDRRSRVLVRACEHMTPCLSDDEFGCVSYHCR